MTHAPWTILSSRAATASGLCRPSAFGMYVRRDGCGRYAPRWIALWRSAMTMPLGAVRGGIAISGLYDLEPIRLNYLNEKLGLDEAEAERNSPMLNFPPMSGPLIVTYGTAELPELCRQS